MLALALPAEPYWLDLPRGVRCEIRPVTTAVMAAAQAAAARRLTAIRIADPDLDPDMSRGLSFAFLVRAPARHAVTAWEGVGDAAGKPLPLTPEAVERLMDLDDIAAAFWDRATAPVAATTPAPWPATMRRPPAQAQSMRDGLAATLEPLAIAGDDPDAATVMMVRGPAWPSINYTRSWPSRWERAGLSLLPGRAAAPGSMEERSRQGPGGPPARLRPDAGG
jgi:hypothetical protein